MTSPGVIEEPKLTARQLDCMELVKQGLTSKQIARELGISHRTVEAHVAAVIEALQVNNRMAAVTALDKLRRHREETQASRQKRPFEMGDLTRGSEEYLAIFPLSQTEPAAPDPTHVGLLPPFGGLRNEAPLTTRTRWIAVIAVSGVMFSCLILLVIMGVSQLAG